MEKRVYYAKSKTASGQQITVKQHISAVAELAEKYGAKFGMEKQCWLAGLFHDFGKYSDAFQGVLKGTHSNIDHAQAGAAILYRSCGKKENYNAVIETIHGHHDGLEGVNSLHSAFNDNFVEGRRDCANAEKTSALAGADEYKKAYASFIGDFPEFKIPKLPKFEPTDDTNEEVYNLEKMLYTRMIFSCLVDADYSISASDENPDYLKRTEQTDFEPDRLLGKLLTYQKEIREKSTADGALNRMRQQLFEQCGEMGKRKEGLFTLTAPTGTGKTLALLHFALRHCIETGKERIIVVLPFLTLAEQNRDIYTEIIPDILEDHSQSGLDEEAREFAARWSKSFIITTSVGFFEALFAQKPTDCRKLHRIANSVILFDEAQSLPADVTAATLRAVNELCRSYHCTMVFSSATQPDFSGIPHMNWNPTEIMPENGEMFEKLKRTQVVWRLEEKIPLEKIAEEAAVQKSVCVIVNLRRHAAKLFRYMKEKCGDDGMFFITTDLCAAHRREIVRKIKGRLKKKLPCRVVATQCIEAGVDLDFDVLYRALAPLESIIQAAGRCNRDGRNREGGLVMVFQPLEDGCLYPGDWYEEGADLVERMSLKEPVDIHDPENIVEYYKELFRRQKDKEKLRAAIKGCKYKDVAEEYKLISDRGVRIIVPWNQKEKEQTGENWKEKYEEIRKEVTEKGISPSLMREVAPFIVTVSLAKDMLLDYAEPVNFSVRGGKQGGESGYFVLRRQYEKLYTEDMGLQFPEKVTMTGIW